MVSSQSSSDHRPKLDLKETVYGVRKRLNFVYESLRKMDRADPAVLDVGCGTGELLSIPLAERGFRILGIDVDDQSVEQAQILVQQKGLDNARFQAIDLDQLEERFDVIILSEVIEHVSEPALLLQTIMDHLTPDGHLIITLPNGYGPFEIDDYFWKRNFLGIPRLHRWYTNRFGHQGSLATCNEASPHIQFFTWKRINALLRGSGFSIVSYRPRTFFAGSYTSTLFHVLAKLKLGWLVTLNARIADHLPAQIVAGWMFVCRRMPNELSQKVPERVGGIAESS